MFKNLKIIWLRYFSLIRNNLLRKDPIVIIRKLLSLFNKLLLIICQGFENLGRNLGDETTLNMRLIVDLFNDPIDH